MFITGLDSIGKHLRKCLANDGKLCRANSRWSLSGRSSTLENRPH